jgi:limonene-1,2-epoxide hydrolase
MTSATEARPRMEITQRFLDALDALERDRSVRAMEALFSDAARLSRLGRPAERGRAGVRSFWGEYLDQFADQVESQFSRIIETNAVVTLEWTTKGELGPTRAICYSGVSLFEYDQDEIVDFRTYYDSAAFLSDPPAHA